MVQIHDKYFIPYISAEIIKQRVHSLAEKINGEYAGKNPLMIGILNGSFIFAADLFRCLAIKDIIDTGRTLSAFLPEIYHRQPESVKIAAFLTKPSALEYQEVKADYCAFEIENKFVVGYGLDYNGLGRNLPDLYILKE
jgi:hypoxanthine phosphoribosyltransferase